MDFNIEQWDAEKYSLLTEHLFELSDEKYKKFHSSLIPNSDDGFIIGVRMPVLRKLGKEISKGNVKSFLNISQTDFYEQRMLFAIVSSLVKTTSFDELTDICESFIPQITNWALCDGFCSSLKEVKKYKDEFFGYIEKYLLSKNDWAVRFAYVIMLNYYLEDKYIDKVFVRCDTKCSESYYVLMAQAWLIATAYAKFPEKTKEYLQYCKLNDATFNKAIQKCIESFRITNEDKMLLKTLKRH